MKYIFLSLLLSLPTLSSTVSAQITDPRLPISMDADSTDYDGKNSMLLFQGLRLTQGLISVEADEGRASKLDFQDSVWRFSGNVVIDVENGHIECETADLQFEDHQLQLATIEGTPASFELRRPGSDEVTYAEAGRLRYDLSRGVVEFSDNATITEGGNQISSNLLVYNIAEQRINAQSSGNGDSKVKITYTPPDSVEGIPGGLSDDEDDDRVDSRIDDGIDNGIENRPDQQVETQGDRQGDAEQEIVDDVGDGEENP